MYGHLFFPYLYGLFLHSALYLLRLSGEGCSGDFSGALFEGVHIARAIKTRESLCVMWLRLLLKIPGVCTSVGRLLRSFLVPLVYYLTVMSNIYVLFA